MKIYKGTEMYYTKGKIVDITEDQFRKKGTEELGDKVYYAQILTKSTTYSGSSTNELINIQIKPETVNEYKSKIDKDEEFKLKISSKTQVYLTAI